MNSQAGRFGKYLQVLPLSYYKKGFKSIYSVLIHLTFLISTNSPKTDCPLYIFLLNSLILLSRVAILLNWKTSSFIKRIRHCFNRNPRYKRRYFKNRKTASAKAVGIFIIQFSNTINIKLLNTSGVCLGPKAHVYWLIHGLRMCVK